MLRGGITYIFLPEIALSLLRLFLHAAQSAYGIPVREIFVRAGAALVIRCLRSALSNSSGFNSGE